MSERETNHSKSGFKEKIKPLGRKVAFPLSSVILAVAAACAGGDKGSIKQQNNFEETKAILQTETPFEQPTETPLKPRCTDEYADYEIHTKFIPENAKQLTNIKVAVVDGGLYIMNPDGSDVKQLSYITSLDSSVETKWSPKGNLLAARTDVGYDGPSWYIFDLDGNRLATIDEARSVSWSPDGTSVLYDEWGGIYELNLVKGNVCQIIESTYNNSDLYPVLSNDGSKLIFAHKEDNYHIMLLDINRNEIPYIGDSRFQNKINESFKELIEIPYGYPPEEIRFQWTPDNSKVIFSLTKKGNTFPTIFVADVINNSVSEINTNNFYPYSTLDVDLSHDGTRIAFFDDDVGLYFVNIDGTNLKQIYQGGKGGLGRAAFERGQKEAFGNTKEQAESIFRDRKPRWSPDDSQIIKVGQLNSLGIISEDGPKYGEGAYSPWGENLSGLVYEVTRVAYGPTHSGSWSPFPQK